MKNKKRYLWIVATVATLCLAVIWLVNLNSRQISPPTTTKSDKIYVATEDSGTVDVISTSTRSILKSIALTQEGSPSMYMSHNVQVAPDGKTVWATANAMSEGNGSHDDTLPPDQVIVIDPARDEIVRRIDIGKDLHLAHVVLTPDSRYALVVAQESGEVYKIDTSSYQITQTTKTTAGAEPHGLRLSPDGNTAYIAMLTGKSIAKLDIQAFTFDYIPLNGKAVQTAVTPDGRYVAASVYDSRSVAVYDTANQKLQYAQLPDEAKGPLQLYPTPDSAYVYVADQGNYFNQPDGNKLYKIDLNQQKVVQTIEAGTAPHGVVVSPDGKFTYVTNLVSNDVSVIDNTAGREVARIPTGKKPNGISYWVHN